jgi:hypothetical protein
MVATVLAGCDSLLEVENPNNLVQEDLGNPSAAEGLANGSLATVARGTSFLNAVYATATDELLWVGSRDAWGTLGKGDLTDPANEFSDRAYPFVSEARWMALEAVNLLSEFDGAGDLVDRTVLGRAYLYAGIIHATIADSYDDFVFSDRKEPGTPIGEGGMASLYDQAVSFLDQGLSIAQSEGDTELQTGILAVRARVKHAKAVWGKLNPTGSVNTTDPLVNDAGAVQDALSAIGLAGGVTADWRYRFNYSSATFANDMADWVNDRTEMSVGPDYVDYEDPATRRFPKSVILLDPIDQIPDPAVERAVFNEFIPGGRFSPQTVISARELHLIVAEAELAQGNTDGFTTHVNHVRAMDGLTPYSGQVDAMDLLVHARRVNMFMQLRRLSDHYRFADPSSTWVGGSEAITRPGTFLPIAITEIRANPNVGG